MSIKLMGQVWESANVSGSELLVLLALADFANDDGESIYPSMATIAKKARLSVDQARRVIHKLIEAGIVELVELGGWTGKRNRSNEYRIVLSALGVLANCKGGTSTNARGGTRAHASTVLAPMQDDPSYNHPIEPSWEGERTPPPIASPEPTNKVIRVKSIHLDPRHFVDGYIPEGTGTNAVEVYYERFSINHDSARLNAIKEDDLVRLCPDLDKLRGVVTAYSRTNFQNGNVQLILDWYNSGIPDKHKPPGQARNSAMGDEEKAALRTRARLAMRSLETAQKFKGNIDPAWQQDIEKAKGAGVI